MATEPAASQPSAHELIRGADHRFDANVQASSVAALFAISTKSEEARSFLLKRRLDYISEEARWIAAYEFRNLLRDDPQALLSICREGLNDPVARVRLNALGSAQNILYQDGVREKPWPEDTIDETIDLLATRGLTDNHFETANHALQLLNTESSLKPNRQRLRALRRAQVLCPHKQLRDPIGQLITEWSFVVEGGKRNPPRKNEFP